MSVCLFYLHATYVLTIYFMLLLADDFLKSELSYAGIVYVQRYYSHNNDYLEICRCYKSIYEIPSVKENPAKWTPVSFLLVLFFFLPFLLL